MVHLEAAISQTCTCLYESKLFSPTCLTVVDFLTIPVSSIDVSVRITTTFKTMKFLKFYIRIYM